ncbi:MAG: hypothetical protein ACOC97_03900 [Myxococcota bacterium]
MSASVLTRFAWGCRWGWALALVGLLVQGCSSGSDGGPPEVVRMDIEPGTCPNPLPCDADGTLVVAITGLWGGHADDFDPESVLLEGVAPERWSHQDVATPVWPEDGIVDDCVQDCGTDGADGISDLVLEFDAETLVQALQDQGFAFADDTCTAVRLTGRRTAEAGGDTFDAWDVIRPSCP